MDMEMKGSDAHLTDSLMAPYEEYAEDSFAGGDESYAEGSRCRLA